MIDFIMLMLKIVNFLSQVIFVFLLFLGIEMYTDAVETKGNFGPPKVLNLCRKPSEDLSSI